MGCVTRGLGKSDVNGVILLSWKMLVLMVPSEEITFAHQEKYYCMMKDVRAISLSKLYAARS